jgi:uncharacterized membrane protein
MKAIEAKIDALNKEGRTEASTMSTERRQCLLNTIRALEADRETLKKAKATTEDVMDSMIEIAKLLPDVDMHKAEVFAEALIKNCITKWELRVATEEIIRTRTRFTAVAEYFLAIDRLKARLKSSGHNIFHETALDF